MKLGELRGAIRKTKGNPIIQGVGSIGLSVECMKGPLLEELDRLFPAGRAAETGFEFDTESRVLTIPGCAAWGPSLIPTEEEVLGGSLRDDNLLLDLVDADEDELLV